VPDDKIATVLSNCRDPSEASQRLIDLALAPGGRDNVTAVVIVVDHGTNTNPPTDDEETTIPRPIAQENQ